MNHLLDVTGRDIGSLSDSELRVLTGKLCEADYLQAGLPTREITWGGHQDAADGGVDVRIRRLTELDPTNVQPPSGSHVPRAETVFQCKQTNMPKSNILAEMTKADVVLLLSELAASDGAYVIVSGESTTDSMLKARIDAMRESVASIPERQRLALDFYDQSRIASWVQRHPALILWVLEKVGRPFSGWRSYGYWASGRGTEDDCYLLDERAKLILPNSTVQAVAIEAGIQELRQQLSNPGRAVRLVGLSGVGKTRLVQALFDPRIGTEHLNRHQVYYADGSQTPQPNPIQLANQLIAGRHSALLVIDNCSEQLHRDINDRCCQENSTVRLLTIEYDIKEDVLTETDVYRLQTSDDKLIEALISQRYPDVSQIDRSTIAAFAEGNTRVALALAESVLHGGSLAGLGNNELFSRLFYQRNGKDGDLLDAAKAASLVYSFSIDENSVFRSEHAVLASLYEQTPQAMLRMLAKLKRRELLQSRGPWRAILPQAISNRLAKEALEDLSLPRILQAFQPEINHRLLKSFCHRIGFLHEQPIAVQCASDLLSEGGLIGSPLLRSETWRNYVSPREHWELHCLAFLAPANPEAALGLIEVISNGPSGGHFTSRNNPHFSRVVGLLCKLAYSPELFPRAIAILLRFALNERPGENCNSIRHQIKTLFQLYLSGTMAPQAMRQDVIKELVDAEDPIKNGLGFYLLETMLQSSGFMSWNSFDFGSRSRDFGYIPITSEGVQNWYETTLNFCADLSASDHSHSIEVRALLARQWCSLWLNIRLYALIEKITRDLHTHRPWADGWLAIRQTIRFHGNELAPEIQARLELLAADLTPEDIIEKVCLYVCRETNDPHVLDLQAALDTEISEESFSRAYKRLEAKAYDLGVAVGEDRDLISQLLPYLVTARSNRIKAFCKGLASRNHDMNLLLESFCSAWKQADPSTRSVDMLIGILEQYAASDRALYELILDQLMVDNGISMVFPCIQLDLEINDQAVERLITCIDLDGATLHCYRNLGHMTVVNRIDKEKLLRLLIALKDVEHGDPIIIDCLALLISSSCSDQLPISFLDLAREIMGRQIFVHPKPIHPTMDYELERIGKACLSGDEGADVAKIVSSNLLEGILSYSVTGYGDYPRLMDALATCQPAIFLDVFLGSRFKHQGIIGRVFDSASWHDNLGHRYNSLCLIENKLLLDWCEAEPDHRFAALAEAVQLFYSAPDEAGRPGLLWSPLALELLSKAPNTIDILKEFESVFYPRSWTGSRADIIEERLPLFHPLEQHQNPTVAAWASAKRAELAHYATELRRQEEREHSMKSHRFE
jgi:hypothetical protein